MVLLITIAKRLQKLSDEKSAQGDQDINTVIGQAIEKFGPSKGF